MRIRSWLRRSGLEVLLPLVIIYVPLLLTAPGKVGSDTKSYLYIDPGRLLTDAPYIWHDRIGLGTVTHQNIGYLFPTGPWYWLFDTAGVPDWVAQRLWLGSILFGAALGVRYLLRTINWRGTIATAPLTAKLPVLVAMLAYALSPYYLAYAARISVILLPWAALPWLVALTARAVRDGGWRYPAWFAFVVLVVGGINATALLLVGLGPLLWLAYVVVVERSSSLRQAVAAALRIGVLTVLTSLWWIAGLFVQGTHGLPVIRYTETFKTVAEASTAPEVLRGLGYWFFYGNDKLGPWIEPSVTYTQNLPLLVLSFALPALALLSAVVVRWRHRGLFALLVMVGGLVAVGGHPWGGASLLGGIFTTFTRTDAGLSLRSTPRAVPLLVLGTAVLLGALAEAARRQFPTVRLASHRLLPTGNVFAAALVVAIVANMPPLWTGSLVADNLQRDEDLPDYWLEVAAAIDAGDHDYRVLELPGTDFAAYRWGNTVDPVTPGLTDRPWVARELFQYGTAPSANLLNAFDRRFHEDTIDAAAVAPVARLLGVDTLLVRSDLQYERYRLARPRMVWDLLTGLVAEGELGPPRPFGPTDRNTPEASQPLVDEIELALDPELPDPPAVALLEVPDAAPITRSVSAANPLVVAGDGDGIVDAAGAGILDASQLLVQSAWFAPGAPGDPAVLDEALANGADLLVTDTNRRRAARWGTLRENNGYTEFAGEEALVYDPTDQRLDVFPGAGDDTRSVTVVQASPGDVVATAQATAWGNPVTLTPDDRPMAALDGDPTTAWRVGAVDDPIGEQLVIDLSEPVTTDRITLLQPTTLSRNRWITTATITLGDSPGPGDALGANDDLALDVNLDDRSRDAAGGGQHIDFELHTFDRVTIEITGTNAGRLPRYDGQSGVGLAVVGIDGVSSIELVRAPVDLINTVGSDHGDHRLMYLLSRLRSNPAEPVRGDPETAMRRLVAVPGPRAFTLSGQARLSAFIDDAAIDDLLAGPTDRPPVSATSSERLPGSLRHRASAALDGDDSTFWSSPFEQYGEVWLDVSSDQPVSFDSADLTVLNDGRHSVPRRIRIEVADTAQSLQTIATFDFPDSPGYPAAPGTRPDNSTSPLSMPLETPVTTNRVRIVVEELHPVTTTDWYSNLPVVMPVAIANVDIDGLQAPAPPARFTSGCRDDLLTIGGTPVPVVVSGPTSDALARRPLAVSACDGEAVTMGGGQTGDTPVDEVVVATDGRTTGLDIDQLLLASAAGGEPLPAVDLPRQLPPGPSVTIDATGRVRTTGTIQPNPDGAGWWLIQGQSWSSGWTATLGDGTTGEQTLGTPQLVNGFANGWPIPSDPPLPATGQAPVPLTVEWAPQRVVWVALGVSAVAVLAVLALMLLGRHRRRQQDLAALPPTFDWLPWARHADLHPASGLATVGAGIATGVVAALNLPGGHQWLALPLALVAAAAVRWVPARNLPALVALGSFGLAAAFTVLQQFRNRYPSDFVWPGEFTRVHILGVIALLAIGVAALRDMLEQRAHAHTPLRHDPE